MHEKIKILEDKLKNEEEKNRTGNQEKIQQSAIQEKNQELEKIKNELGEKGGAGHVFGKDTRPGFDEEKVRRILRGLEAGLTEVNFKERIRIAFYFLFFVSTRFSSKQKFNYLQNLEVREGGWYFRQQTRSSDFGGSGFWKIWLTRNGKNFLNLKFLFLGRRVEFKTDADEINGGEVKNSAKNLRPDSKGMVKFESGWLFFFGIISVQINFLQKKNTFFIFE